MTSNSHHVLGSDNFDKIKGILFDVAGISLADTKRKMAENRINKRLQALNMQSYDQYINYIKCNKDIESMNLVNALTTNVTHFFRESHHFDHLQEELINMINNNTSNIRIWSAGCSIGAEPYSMAITTQRANKKTLKNSHIKILATDIDTIALSRARQGKYTDNVAKGLDKSTALEFFNKTIENGNKTYAVKPKIREMVSFNHLNLNNQIWPMSGMFDFIFCRNLLIYFKDEKQQEFLSKMKKLLRPGGFLYLGHSEHLAMDQSDFTIVGQTIYRKPE